MPFDPIAVDTALLWFVRGQVPATFDGFFTAVTRSAASLVLVPLALVCTALLWAARRRREAWLIGGSLAGAEALGWGLKAMVGRARPALWATPESAAVWGSSFPSGHSLNAAAFATAAALCVLRLWPRAGPLAVCLAALWAALVGVSRLVLGVHWPSDVLAGLCLGVAVGCAFSRAGASGSARSPGP